MKSHLEAATPDPGSPGQSATGRLAATALTGTGALAPTRGPSACLEV